MAKRTASESILHGVIVGDLQPVGVGIAVIRLDADHVDAILAEIAGESGKSRPSMPITQAPTILHVATARDPATLGQWLARHPEGKGANAPTHRSAPSPWSQAGPSGTSRRTCAPERLHARRSRAIGSHVSVRRCACTRSRDCRHAVRAGRPDAVSRASRKRSVLRADSARSPTRRRSRFGCESPRGAHPPPGLASALQDDTRATRALAQSVLGLLSRR